MSRLSSDSDNLAIAERLTAIRQSSGLTQTEFADKLDLSARAYQNYERGDREAPIAVLTALYRAFQIDPLWVLVGPGTKPSYADHRAMDVKLMEDIIVLVEQQLTSRRFKLAPQKKARLIRLIYDHCMEEGQIDSAYIKEMISLTE